MRQRAKKGSVPVVCYNKTTDSYLGLDEDHPLMAEDYIIVIGSILEYDMNGKPRTALPADQQPKKLADKPEDTSDVVKDFLVGTNLEVGGKGDESLLEDEEPEIPAVEGFDEVPVELDYYELKDKLTELGVDFKGNASKEDLQILLDETLNPIQE